MKKECVFCGNKPEEKTSEHIIPQWLIALTGDPNREIFIGFKKDKPIGLRKFSFNSFKFPACNNCNSRFSKLEDNTKVIIEKILNLESISNIDLIPY